MASVAGAAPLAQGESYTVQKDDSLWNIAEKYLGNGAAYPAIVDATNKKAAEDPSFATIVNPSLIQPGWKLWVPSTEEAEAFMATYIARRGGVLRIAFDGADLKTLDPHFAATTLDRAVVDMIFNGLVRYKPGDISVFEPDLAESIPEPEMVDGKQVWTFKLREEVMCHPYDGNPAYELTSEDVVYSLERAADAERSAYAGEYTGMSFEAVDEYTVKITLDKPISPALLLPKVADYAGGFIVCKKAVEDLGDEAFKTHPVGTGPFMFARYIPMERTILASNDQYFRGQPDLDGVEVYYIPDISSRELGLQKGELDVVEGLREQPWIDKMKGLPNTAVDTFGPGETVVLHLDTAKDPLGDLKVRQAIAYALRRDDFLAFFGADPSEPLYSAVPLKYLPGGLTKDEAAEAGLLYEVDREKAKALLAEAGFAEGFSMEANTSERASYRKTYESIQAQLREVGIALELKVVDHSTMHTLIRDDANPVVIYIAWRPNADVFLTRFYHSASIVVTGAKPDTNFSHYTGIDDLIEAARVEADPDKQVELWKEAQTKILEEAVAYPLFVLGFVFARNPGVEWGYELKSTLALYPQVTEQTRLVGR
jgi:peptide/nickel transport system substrate-binding protein